MTHLIKKLYISEKQKRFLYSYEYLKKKDEEIKKWNGMVKFFRGSQWPEKYREAQRELSKARKNFDAARNMFYRSHVRSK